MGYYPFALSIRNSETWFDFSSGEMIVFVIVNHEVLEQKLLAHGIRLKYNPNSDWYSDSCLEVSSVMPLASFSEIYIGSHFFGRVFTKVLSLQWMIDSIVDRMKSVIEKHPREEGG